MKTVTVTRTIDCSPEPVRDAILEVKPFMRAAGFDTVSVDGRKIEVGNRVGVIEIELALRTVDEPDAVLAYEQVEGIFKSMSTAYFISAESEGSTVTATTEFALDVAVIGEFLDAAVISRQRRRELKAQFDYLESATVDGQLA